MTSIAELMADHQALKLQTNEQCEVITRQMAEIAELKAQLAELTQERDNLEADALTVEELDRIASEAYANGFAAGKPETNFDDANLEFYWAAADGDVVFWKVPCELHDLTEEDDETSRVLSAFQRERFGYEWGCLSSHSVRMMTLAILEENE